MNPRWRTWPGRGTLLVVLIALHSYAIGLILLFASGWAVDVGGWQVEGSRFFTRQGGAFHLVVASIYLWAWWRHRSIAPIVIAKSLATVFLLAMSLRGEPLGVLLSGIADAAMLAILLAVRARS